MTDFRLGASRHPPNFLGSLGACQIEILERNESHMSNHPPYHIITYACDDMSLRQSISGFRKKVKDKLSKIGNKTGEERPNVTGEGFDHPTLSLQSEPPIAMGGELGNIEAGAGKDDPRPDDPLPVSRSAMEIGHDQGKSDDKASGGEISQQELYPHPHVLTESGFSQKRREVERLQGQELDGSTRKALLCSTS